MEQKLRELLTLTTPQLTARGLSHAWEFLDHNELELCLETIAGGLAGQQVSSEVADLVTESAVAMELTEGISYQMFFRCLS